MRLRKDNFLKTFKLYLSNYFLQLDCYIKLPFILRQTYTNGLVTITQEHLSFFLNAFVNFNHFIYWQK